MVSQQIYRILRSSVLVWVSVLAGFFTGNIADDGFHVLLLDAGCGVTDREPFDEKPSIIMYGWTCYGFSLTCRDRYTVHDGKLGYRMVCSERMRPGVGSI